MEKITRHAVVERNKENKLVHIGLAIASLLMYLIITFAISYMLAAYISRYIDISQGKGLSNFIYIVQILSGVIVSAIIYVIMKKRGESWFKANKQCDNITRLAVPILVLFISFIFVQNSAGILLNDILHAEKSTIDQMSIITVGNPILSLLGVCIIAPACEELVFRGAIYGSLRKIMKMAPATIISSMVFGLVHFDGWISLVMVLMGAILCTLFEATGNLIFPVSFHTINNIVAFLGAYFKVSLVLPENNIVLNVILFISLMTLIFSSIVIICMKPKNQ